MISLFLFPTMVILFNFIIHILEELIFYLIVKIHEKEFQYDKKHPGWHLNIGLWGLRPIMQRWLINYNSRRWMKTQSKINSNNPYR